MMINKQIWLIKHKETGDILFTYHTERGNTKKAIFSSEREANNAINNFETVGWRGNKIHAGEFMAFMIGNRYENEVWS